MPILLHTIENGWLIFEHVFKIFWKKYFRRDQVSCLQKTSQLSYTFFIIWVQKKKLIRQKIKVNVCFSIKNLSIQKRKKKEKRKLNFKKWKKIKPREFLRIYFLLNTHYYICLIRKWWNNPPQWSQINLMVFGNLFIINQLNWDLLKWFIPFYYSYFLC